MRKYNQIALSKLAHVFIAVGLVGVLGCSDDTDPGGGSPSPTGGTAGGGGEGGAGGSPTMNSGGGGQGGDGQGGDGQGGGEPPMAPPLRNPVAIDDDTLALEALSHLGAPDGVGTMMGCSQCHSVNRGLMRHWAELTSASDAGCLSDTSVRSKEAAETIISCLRAKPSNPTSPFEAAKLGIYSAAAHLPWFEFVFKQAYGDAWEPAYAEFKGKVAMPKGDNPPYSQEAFDTVAEWFARGLPLFEELLPEEPPPAECETTIGTDVAAHVAEMRAEGWRAVNAENGILMHGCAGAASPRDCLTTYPRASEIAGGSGWELLPGAQLRILHEQTYSSSYWTRSSADGRFVAHGGSSGGGAATIVDLVSDRAIPTNASYDPGFFPDNSGFVFQGAGASFCEQSLLTSSPAEITFSEPECTTTGQVGLYQHVGASLGGSDYWVVDSYFVSDDGGHGVTIGDPMALFASDSPLRLTPMIHTGSGSGYTPGTTVELTTPFEGDTVISPSSRLLVTRAAGAGFTQNGLVLRRLNATPGPSGYSVDTPQIARYCVSGGKPAFSFDERWLALHHYVSDSDAVAMGFTGPEDPGFAPYRARGASNILLLDVLTGQVVRVTNMQPGQYALFPHFRSDGWIYFVVRYADSSDERVVASDAALVQEATP